MFNIKLYKKVALAIVMLVSTQVFAIKTVPYVDLNLYIGRWYEINRLPNSFQDFKKTNPCFNTTATYSIDSWGAITVVNKCFFKDSSSVVRTEVAHGKAIVIDEVSQAQLKVNFIPLWQYIPGLRQFGSGPYWIVGLGPLNEQGLYSWAAVVSPRKDGTISGAWILARDPDFQSNENEYTEALNALEKNGIDLQKLIESRK